MLSVVALSQLLIACEYPGIPHPLTAQAAEQAGPALTAQGPQGQAPAEARTPNPQRPLALQEKVEVRLKDFLLDPDRVTVKAGTVTFVLTNDGQFVHDFRVEGQGTDEKAPKVTAGRTFEWQVTLAPGAYRISCPISNHADRGMVGTLEAVKP